MDPAGEPLAPETTVIPAAADDEEAEDDVFDVMRGRCTSEARSATEENAV